VRLWGYCQELWRVLLSKAISPTQLPFLTINLGKKDDVHRLPPRLARFFVQPAWLPEGDIVRGTILFSTLFTRRRWWKLVGIVLLLPSTTAIVAAQTVAVTTLASFDGAEIGGTGGTPMAPLVQGVDGNFYGTTYYGGANASACNNGTMVEPCGTIFKITPLGKLSVVYNFGQGSVGPAAGLAQGIDGSLYGTTAIGINDSCNTMDCGVIFKISPSGSSFTTLYSFCSQPNCADGAMPQAGLIQGTDQNFYGTTLEGGAQNCAASGYGLGCGTVFRVTPAGKQTTLYTFCRQTACPDGSNPQAGLVQGTDGNFYGTTRYGGANGSFSGTVFKITPVGKLTTLYSFCSVTNCADGYNPIGGLVQGADGNFYGATLNGGIGGGTIFKITPSGQLTTLYLIGSHKGDGGVIGGVVQATDGNFYGATFDGGSQSRNCPLGCGTVFKVTSAGTLTTLANFCSQSNCSDGAGAEAGPIQGTVGNLYGTTSAGGTSNAGTVWGLRTGLGPFIETRLTMGKVGAPVIILGYNLTGTSSVTFNGTTATFTVVSNTEIKTTVPAGATTGTVQVVTPSGTLSSNVPYQVMQ
jgi:uncharacterized repeat protein (TIGR03803 family)